MVLLPLKLSSLLEVLILSVNESLLRELLSEPVPLGRARLELATLFSDRVLVGHSLGVIFELPPFLLFLVVLAFSLLDHLLDTVVRFSCTREEVTSGRVAGIDCDFSYARVHHINNSN